MTDKSDTKKGALIEALGKSLGVVSTACKSVNISRDTHYRWMKEDSDYKGKVRELENIALDFAESHLHQLIKDGIPSATIFFLKTKGKRRGYIETTDLQITEKKPLTWMDEVSRKKKREQK
jgi:hypothetical protein|tara:strand:+ start:9096 stop:9458 length:363 start_codon:yes stop_codon:yes gene_type:complete